MGHRGGATVGRSGQHGEYTHNHWMPGCQVCRLNDLHEIPLLVKGQFACCLGAAGEIWKTLVNLMAHGENVHQECGEKCCRQV